MKHQTSRLCLPLTYAVLAGFQSNTCHILDLVLPLVGVDLVNRVEVSPIDHRISDHALITFELD